MSFDCNGKDGVLSVVGLITREQRYLRSWVAFFVDADFDDNTGLDKRVFVTPCYSVENLYVTDTAFQRIMENEFHMTPGEDDFNFMAALYHKRLEQFNDAATELNAWIFLQRRQEKAQATSSRVNITSLHPSRLFSVTLAAVHKSYTRSNLRELFPHSADIPDSELNAQIQIFLAQDRTLRFRGKYLIEFLRLFLMCLKEDQAQEMPTCPFNDRGKAKLNLSRVNLISELSQYADTPDGLAAFLKELTVSEVA